MPRKHYAMTNIPMVKTKDPEGHLVIESKAVTSTFLEEGTLTFNNNNGLITWNSGDITHINFGEPDFMIMYDAETNLLSLTHGERSLYYQISDLINMVDKSGVTEEELEKILAEKETNDGRESE